VQQKLEAYVCLHLSRTRDLYRTGLEFNTKTMLYVVVLSAHKRNTSPSRVPKQRAFHHHSCSVHNNSWLVGGIPENTCSVRIAIVVLLIVRSLEVVTGGYT
jgi:hypothetical protein